MTAGERQHIRAEMARVAADVGRLRALRMRRGWLQQWEQDRLARLDVLLDEYAAMLGLIPEAMGND